MIDVEEIETNPEEISEEKNGIPIPRTGTQIKNGQKGNPLAMVPLVDIRKAIEGEVIQTHN